MSKLKNIVKKTKNLNVSGLIDGIKQYRSGIIDETIVNRASICASCDKMEDEPIKSLRVNDDHFPDLSGKMCGECYCALSLKVRSKKDKCPLKKW